VIVGEITDAQAIDESITGADAVASALGPSMDRHASGLPLAEGNRLIVAAMDRHGVRRYVGNGTPTVLDHRDRRTLQLRFSAFLARTFLRRAYNEMVQMSKAITTSDLDWTIVRFMAPRNGPRRWDPRHHCWPGNKHLPSKSRSVTPPVGGPPSVQ
jgi:hypothetical protein